jgi:hypothetical protein
MAKKQKTAKKRVSEIKKTKFSSESIEISLRAIRLRECVNRACFTNEDMDVIEAIVQRAFGRTMMGTIAFYFRRQPGESLAAVNKRKPDTSSYQDWLKIALGKKPYPPIPK